MNEMRSVLLEHFEKYTQEKPILDSLEKDKHKHARSGTF